MSQRFKMISQLTFYLYGFKRKSYDNSYTKLSNIWTGGDFRIAITIKINNQYTIHWIVCTLLSEWYGFMKNNIKSIVYNCLKKSEKETMNISLPHARNQHPDLSTCILAKSCHSSMPQSAACIVLTPIDNASEVWG